MAPALSSQITPAGSLETEDVLHVVATGRSRRQPVGCAHRAPGKGHAARGLVGDLDPLAVGGEHHRVVADDIPGAHRGKADGVPGTGAGLALAAVDGHLPEIAPK